MSRLAAEFRFLAVPLAAAGLLALAAPLVRRPDPPRLPRRVLEHDRAGCKACRDYRQPERRRT